MDIPLVPAKSAFLDLVETIEGIRAKLPSVGCKLIMQFSEEHSINDANDEQSTSTTFFSASLC